jgi:hypothetical protein
MSIPQSLSTGLISGLVKEGYDDAADAGQTGHLDGRRGGAVSDLITMHRYLTDVERSGWNGGSTTSDGRE